MAGATAPARHTIVASSRGPSWRLLERGQGSYNEDMTRLAVPGLVALGGCASEATVVQDMEETLRATQVVVAAQLVATELLVQALADPEPEPGLRHGDGCGCPCIERIGEGAPLVVEVDYPNTGCLPTSGLIPNTLSGHAVLTYDGDNVTVGFDALALGGGHPVAGTLNGEPALDGSSFGVDADLTMGTHTVALATETVLNVDDQLTIGGSATVEGASFEVRGVQLPWAKLAPPCPTPVGGTVERQSSPRVDVDFASPGDGSVTVHRRRRASDAVDYCAYRVDLM